MQRGQRLVLLAVWAILDGEGGYTVWGKLMPAGDSLALGALPIGLAHGIKLTRSVAVGKVLTWADVSAEESETVRFRQEMEAVYGKEMQEVEE